MRLIDADALLERMKHRKYYIGRPSDPDCLVEDAPTIDAVPVAHGLWINENCSICGQYIYQGDVRYYCPNCGAKMDEERREDDEQPAIYKA